MKRKLISLTGFSLLLLVGIGVARADTLFYLNQGSCCTLPGAGYYGTVDLAQNGTNVDVTVQLYVGANPSDPDLEFISTGSSNGNSHETFSFNDPSVTATSQVTNVAFTPSETDTLLANVSQSGFGSFSIGIDCTSCGTGSSGYPGDPTKLTFTVDNVNISSFQANSDGTLFAADVYDNLNGKTGIVADDGIAHNTPVVPEPPTLLLFGTGLATLAGGLKLKWLSGI